MDTSLHYSQNIQNMTAITPSPNRPRQRISPSPTGKDCLQLNRDIPTLRSNGMKFGDRKDLQQYSYAALPQPATENYSPKGELSSRNQGHRHASTYCKQVVAVLTLIVLVVTALSFFIPTAPIFNTNLNSLLGIRASRSLTLKMDGRSVYTNTDTSHQFSNSDNPSPRIVWLMSFPNRYVLDSVALIEQNRII